MEQRDIRIKKISLSAERRDIQIQPLLGNGAESYQDTRINCQRSGEIYRYKTFSGNGAERHQDSKISLSAERRDIQVQKTHSGNGAERHQDSKISLSAERRDIQVQKTHSGNGAERHDTRINCPRSGEISRDKKNVWAMEQREIKIQK
jgi:hypothetical protein